MKKLALLLVFVVGFLTANCQIVDKKFFGSASDTLTASTTFSFTQKIEGKTPYNLSTTIFSDFDSDTTVFSTYFAWSLDGVNFVDIDTVSSAKGVVDKLVSFTSLTFFPGTYFRVRVIATAEVQKSKLFGRLKTWYKY